MSNFKAFMAGNAVRNEIVNYVASKRFVEDGEAIAWELHAISSEKDEALRKECTKKIPIAGKRGQSTKEVDTEKYIGKLCAACITYPNLNDAELQDSYQVKSAEELLKRMLLPGEYADLQAKVMEINGYDMTIEDLVDEAKN